MDTRATFPCDWYAAVKRVDADTTWMDRAGYVDRWLTDMVELAR
jgi:hypothetical protein